MKKLNKNMYIGKGFYLLFIAVIMTIFTQPKGDVQAQDVIVKIRDGTEIEVKDFYFFSNTGTGRNSNPYDGFVAKRKGKIEKTYKFDSIKRVDVKYDDGKYKTKITFDNGEAEKCTESDVHYIMGEDSRGNEIEIATHEIKRYSVIFKE